MIILFFKILLLLLSLLSFPLLLCHIACDDNDEINNDSSKHDNQYFDLYDPGTICTSVVPPTDPTLNFAIQEGGCFEMEIICPAGSSIGIATPGSNELVLLTTDDLASVH
ncbi:unnamed protein product, partial [Mesorhabditis belari]|uniref:Uncharacterized protein n=1 Tax=Mesorhabditis belari TaxID=2138241 RepID=A0AAF3F7F1_9BILA